MNDLLATLSKLFGATKGYKTYVAAAGLIGLGVYQISTYDADISNVHTGVETILAGLGMLGLRHAIPAVTPAPAPAPAPAAPEK